MKYDPLFSLTPQYFPDDPLIEIHNIFISLLLQLQLQSFFLFSSSLSSFSIADGFGVLCWNKANPLGATS